MAEDGSTTVSRVDLTAAALEAVVIGHSQGPVEAILPTDQAFLWTAKGGLYSAPQR